MASIDPIRDLRLAREFMATPIGHHSPDLQRLLRTFRGEPVKGKYALLITKPSREWMLIELSGDKGVPFKLHRDQVFTSLADAERAVFRLRWKRHTGQDMVLEGGA